MLFELDIEAECTCGEELIITDCEMQRGRLSVTIEPCNSCLAELQEKINELEVQLAEAQEDLENQRLEAENEKEKE